MTIFLLTLTLFLYIISDKWLHYLFNWLPGKLPMIKLFILPLLLVILSGCSWLYKQDVQQGNIITPMQVSMLRKGMTKEDVRYVLGTPVMSHILNCDRWDYAYTYRKGYGPMQVKRLSLYFNQRWLASLDSCAF